MDQLDGKSDMVRNIKFDSDNLINSLKEQVNILE